MRITVSRDQLRGNYQVRDGLSKNWLGVLREVEEFDEPPQVVAAEDGFYEVVDGHHELAVLAERGMDDVEVEVVEGNPRLLAATANARHDGLPLSKKERERAILWVREAEPTWTQGQIAKVVRVSQTTVSNVLRAAGFEPVAEATVQRREAVLAAHQEDPKQTQAQIAAKVGVSQPMVSNTLRAAKAPPKPGRGAPYQAAVGSPPVSPVSGKAEWGAPTAVDGAPSTAESPPPPATPTQNLFEGLRLVQRACSAINSDETRLIKTWGVEELMTFDGYLRMNGLHSFIFRMEGAVARALAERKRAGALA